MRTVTLGPEATDEERSRARELAANVDRVVVAISCRTLAWKGRGGLTFAHTGFVRSLAGLKAPVSVVALGSPWVLAKSCPPGCEAIVAYGDDPASQRAAAQVLLGSPAPGKLPVEAFALHA